MTYHDRDSKALELVTPRIEIDALIEGFFPTRRRRRRLVDTPRCDPVA